jgi:hypothetical protein
MEESHATLTLLRDMAAAQARRERAEAIARRPQPYCVADEPEANQRQFEHYAGKKPS